MFTANVLNPNATTNSYKTLASMDFIPGKKVKLVIQLVDSNEDLRYVPPSTAIVSLIFNNTDGTTLTKASTPFTDDRSMHTFNLSEAESAGIYGGNVLLKIDNLGDGTSVDEGIIYNCLQKITIDS